MRVCVRLCALFLFFLAGQAFAADRVALVVANGEYKAAALSNPNVDAGLVSKALTDVGFDVTIVENVSLEHFDSALAEFARKAKGADLALFYYAGHGFAVNDRGVPRNYLMSVDADVASTSERVLRAGGMPLDDIILAISEQARTTLVFIDACRNDPRVSRAVGGAGRSAVPIDNDIGESIFVGLSTRAGDVATDGAPGVGSPFARAFAARIGTPDARLDDTFTQIRLMVEKETGRDQRPDVGRYDLLAPIILKPSPPAAPAVAALPEPPSALAAAPQRDVQPPAADAPAQIAAVPAVKPQIPAGEDPVMQCELFAGRSGSASDDVDFMKVDSTRAIPACQAAVTAKPGDARLMSLLGRSLDRDRQFLAAADWYLKAADLGDARALNNLGILYERGEGVARDYTKAREFFEKAAALDFAGATNKLALMYDNGTGVKRDPAKAMELYQRAATLGEPIAYNNIGTLYEDGAGVKRDYAKAREYYERSAALGEGLALTNIGDLYELGRGVAKNQTKAREFYQKAADLGNGAAFHQLGYYADDGIAGPRDSEAAARYLELALRKGNDFSLKQMKTNSSNWSPGFRKALQARLTAAGVYDGEADGRFGPATLKAIDAIYDTE